MPALPCFVPLRVRWFVLLLTNLCVTQAFAQEHECSDTRSACDTAMLAQCPGGADVIDDESLPASGGEAPRQHLVFRCRPDGAARAPSPLPAVDNPYSHLRMPLRMELEKVRDTLFELETTPPRYGGPLAMLIVGLPVAAVFTPLAVVAARDLARYDSSSESDDALFVGKRWNRIFLGVFGTLSLVGLGLTTGGIVWLVKRVQARRGRARQSELLRTRERELVKQLDLAFDPAAHELMLVGRF
jgi:hypothetical protein